MNACIKKKNYTSEKSSRLFEVVRNKRGNCQLGLMKPNLTLLKNSAMK